MYWLVVTLYHVYNTELFILYIFKWPNFPTFYDGFNLYFRYNEAIFGSKNEKVHKKKSEPVVTELFAENRKKKDSRYLNFNLKLNYQQIFLICCFAPLVQLLEKTNFAIETMNYT